MAVQTWLFDMPPEVCREHLATTALGRIGVIVDGRPEIFPVNHAYDPETRSIVFPTNEGTKLHAATHWPWIAYEVDGMDADDSSGWSVLVVGRAEPVDPSEVERVAALRSVPWRGGSGVTWIRIVASKMTGRRIKAVTVEDLPAQEPDDD
jgi:hypothetical protein